MGVTKQIVTPQRTRGSRDWTPAFLSALEETGVIKRAAEAAEVSRISVWRRAQEDSDFAKAMQDSLKAGALLLEAEAVRRAKDGLIRKKFTKGGEPIIDPSTGKQYVEHEYSDTLLLALLKRHFPLEYKEKPPETHFTAVTNNIVMPIALQEQIQERRAKALIR